MNVSGYVHRFGDNINTDYIIAARYKTESLKIGELAKHTFADIDSDFISRVQPGDIVVGGRNFGCGSSRQLAVEVLKHCGISAVVAQSFGRIFFRNAINNGLLLVEADSSQILQGDHIEINPKEGRILLTKSGIELETRPLPHFMQLLLDSGGLIPYLRKNKDFSTHAEKPTSD